MSDLHLTRKVMTQNGTETHLTCQNFENTIFSASTKFTITSQIMFTRMHVICDDTIQESCL